MENSNSGFFVNEYIGALGLRIETEKVYNDLYDMYLKKLYKLKMDTLTNLIDTIKINSVTLSYISKLTKNDTSDIRSSCRHSMWTIILNCKRLIRFLDVRISNHVSELKNNLDL
jgi:hypothetical protein